MKFFGTSILISAAYFASVVLAQEPPIISITSPLPNTKFKAGQEAIISWINPTVQVIDQLVLAKGPSNALQPILTIAKDINAKDMKYVWKIPSDIESGTEYAFEFGTSPKMAFAGPFTIENSGGPSASSNNSQNTVPVNKNNVAVAAASPASPSSPSSPSGSSTSSAQSPSHSSGTHASGASKEVANQAMAALGMAAIVAAQFF
ncbi:hypothetical protein A0J61_07788 [Choanephora cucurbitarum]|uniref:Yeast cell wall synthesis Kre9/Knh1-like N-terminal domain-containing protein n=1 Tax=Choanephora cucurbitarum TaxID=101091 RepID=A0A1C7N541_9FUNG|nr:hypothetical protein A0J61_07788 [Choanephora cucurbitarum]